MNIEAETKTRTKLILQVMLVLSWIGFIGLMIKAGAIAVSYGISYANPEGTKNLYKGLNLDPLREFSFEHYTMTVSFMVAEAVMKAYVLFLVIKALSEVKLMDPFKMEVSRILEKISYVLFGTWIIAVLNDAHNSWLQKRSGLVLEDFGTEDLFFMAGIVFILSQIFKRGVEIQSENELTV